MHSCTTSSINQYNYLKNNHLNTNNSNRQIKINTNVDNFSVQMFKLVQNVYIFEKN